MTFCWFAKKRKSRAPFEVDEGLRLREFEFKAERRCQNKTIEMNIEATKEAVDFEAKSKSLEEENEKLKQNYIEVSFFRLFHS